MSCTTAVQFFFLAEKEADALKLRGKINVTSSEGNELVTKAASRIILQQGLSQRSRLTLTCYLLTSCIEAALLQCFSFYTKLATYVQQEHLSYQ